MMNFPEVEISTFLTERKDRFKPKDANALSLKRLEKIDFSGNLHIVDPKPTKTNMILVKKGDLVISGINAEKGAVGIHNEDEDILATIHYSSYHYDKSKINIDYLKWFLKSPIFKKLLNEQVGGGIKTEIKPKKFLPIKVKFPNLPKQTEIAQKLNAFSNESDCLAKINLENDDLIVSLRQAILQLAVQGKLVPQDPTDESASELLKKIKAEKEKLIKEGKIKKQKHLPLIEPDEIPYKLPKSWEWVRISEIANHRLGKMLDKAKNKGKLFPYLRNTNVQWLDFDLSDIKEMRFLKSELDCFSVKKGDLLICEGGEPGRCAIWKGQIKQILFQKAIHRVRPLISIIPELILYSLLADAKSGRLESYLTGATIKHFTGKELAKYLLALPPIAEQKRIVDKVDELMALCDQLEEKIKQSQDKSEKLMAATIHHLLVA